MREFSFAEVEAVIASQFDIASAKRSALRSRIKALQKYGVPNRPATGRGVPASFNCDHILQLSVAMELTSAGLSPQHAAGIVRRCWWSQRALVIAGLDELKDGSGPRRIDLGWAWVVGPDGLSELSNPSPIARAQSWLTPAVRFELQELTWVEIDEDGDSPRTLFRVVVVNTTAFLALFAFSLHQTVGLKIDALIEDLISLEPGIERIGAFLHREIKDRNSRNAGGQGSKPGSPMPADLSEELRVLYEQFQGTSQELRILEFFLSEEAFYELRWIVTPQEERHRSPKQTGEVLEMRRAGQAKLEELGMIEEASGDGFSEPVLTELGKEFLRRFTWFEDDYDVDQKA